MIYENSLNMHVDYSVGRTLSKNLLKMWEK